MLQDSLLRQEARHGTVEPVGAAEPAGVEPDLAVAEEEEHRREREDATSVGSELVASAVHVKLLPASEAFRMREDHAPNKESAETELVGGEDLASATDRTARVVFAELSGDDPDVARLLLRDLGEHVHGADVLPETVGGQLPLAVVGEAPSLADHLEDEIHGFAVALGRVLDRGKVLGTHHVDRRDGVPALRTLGQLRQIPRERVSVLRIETEELRDPLDLLSDGTPTEFRRIDVVGPHLLAHVLVQSTVLGDEVADELGEAGRVVDALRFVLGEAGLVVGGAHDGHELATLGITVRHRRSQCSWHRSHPFFAASSEHPRETRLIL